jgi:hypothetical protein
LFIVDSVKVVEGKLQETVGEPIREQLYDLRIQPDVIKKGTDEDILPAVLFKPSERA